MRYDVGDKASADGSHIGGLLHCADKLFRFGLVEQSISVIYSIFRRASFDSKHLHVIES